MRRRMCKRPLFSFEEIPPERAKYGVRETGKQCLVGPTEAKPGIFAGAKIPGCLLRALPQAPINSSILELAARSDGTLFPSPGRWIAQDRNRIKSKPPVGGASHS